MVALTRVDLAGKRGLPAGLTSFTGGFALGLSAGLGEPAGAVSRVSFGLARLDPVAREADVSELPDGDWTLCLRKRPASVFDGRPDDGRPGVYELVCRDCGDDLRRGYGEVSAELQKVRGPYSLEAAIEAFVAHCE